LPPKDCFVAEAQITVRYAETDAMGIVHHMQYVVYFEVGRTEYSHQRGKPYSEFEETGRYLTVTEISVQYRQPARYDQHLRILTWIESLKSRGLTFAYEIRDVETDQLIANGWTKHICVDHDGKVIRIPEEWRAWAN
jgi:acyl-CoA thioester hydrolase